MDWWILLENNNYLMVGFFLLPTICKVLFQLCKELYYEIKNNNHAMGNFWNWLCMQNDDHDSEDAQQENGQVEDGQSPDMVGPVNYYANGRHNQKDVWFQFLYKKVEGHWLTYIYRMPSLRSRSDDLHLTHRYRKDDEYWICYDPQSTTLKDAQIISRAWADRELEYIATGTPFERQEW